MKEYAGELSCGFYFAADVVIIKKAIFVTQILRTVVAEQETANPVQTGLRFFHPGKEDCPLTIEKAMHRWEKTMLCWI